MKRIGAIWLSIMLTFSSAFLIIDVSEETEGKGVVQDRVEYVPHGPIRINWNPDFVTIASSGDGSPTTPWIIEGWEINGTGLGTCIYIGNTTDHFIIRDCYLHSASSGTGSWNRNLGCHLYSTSNGTILNNSISQNIVGIRFEESSTNNSIMNNTLQSNLGDGIALYYSDNNIINNNQILSNGRHAIELQLTNFNFISNNTMVNGSINMWGSLQQDTSHTIDSLNTVNSKPVYYWKNLTGGKIPLGAGEVILVNCTDVIIENQDLRSGSVGIIIGYGMQNFIQNNTVSSNNCRGIDIHNSNINTIYNNTINSNKYHGLFAMSSFWTMITKNQVSLNGLHGIYLWGSNNPQIMNNTIGFNNERGIYTRHVDFALIVNNTVFLNDQYGLYIDSDSDWNDIYHNSIFMNNIDAYDGSTNNEWDNGYPSGGNEWGAYGGVDLYYGPNQDKIGSDGIGDTNYSSIDGGTNAVDRYPLMSNYDYFEYDIPLQEGWNLISLPIRQLDWSIDSVLESLAGSWDCIQTYHASSEIWTSNNTYRPDVLNDLKEMNHFNAYWINITTPVTLTVKGDKFNSDITIPLNAGWNLVGYPSLGIKSITDALGGTGYDCPVEGFNTSAPYRISQLSDSYMMKPGEGYWVHVPSDTIWIVERTSANPQIAVHDIIFSKVQPQNGELITISAKICNYGSFGIVDVKFYDGVESGENLIGVDIIAVPAQAQTIAQIDWVAFPGGVHSILVTALLNETWASQQGVVDPVPMDNYLDKPLFVFPNILLVDDDNQPNDQSPGDTSSFMRASLEATDFNYDFMVVGAGSNGPGYDYGEYPMENYDIVIWMIGYEIFSTLTLTDVSELEKFLDGGGSLWFISQGFWDEALGDPDLTAFAENYLHTPTMPPILNASLPNQLYGNYTHPVTYTFTDDPLNTVDRLPGMIYERSYWWDVGSVPPDSVALNSSNQCYAVSYDSDLDGANPVVGSRIFVQTWEYSRIEDTATQAQFTYKVMFWLGNITIKFGRDLAISQQDIIPKTVTISETVNISAIIRNNGFTNEIDVEAILFHDSFPEPTSFILTPLIESMGCEWEVSFIWTADTVGTHEFKWMVDPNDHFSETNEFNNQISIYLNNITVEVLP